MKPSFRVIPLAAAFTAAALLTGCDGAEKKKLQDEVAALRAESAAAQSALEKTGRDLDDAVSARNRAEGIAESANARFEVLTAKVDGLKAKADSVQELEDELESVKKDAGDCEAHNLEMKEWIEDSLLPIAEANDPKIASLKKDAEDMAAAVERIRGLKFKRPFMRRLVKREDVGPNMKRDFEREMPREEADKMVAVMAEFGVMEAGTDLYEVFAQFLEGGAAAYYKPNTNTFYLIEGNDGAGARPIVFHELIHAVEDQHYDLTAINKRLEEDGDAALAFKGLVEGSADFFQELYHGEHPEEVKAMLADQMKPELLAKQQQMVQSVPTFLIAMMGLYPYKNGSAFLRGIGVTGPEQAVKVWTDPPTSTEQVLHPEKFSLDGSGRDYPHTLGKLDLSSVLGADWEEVDTANMGELMTGLMLVHLKFPGPRNLGNRFMSVMDPVTSGVGFKPPVSTAIEGWDGDRYTAMRHTKSGEVCVVWTSVWDSEKDATEFENEFGKLIGGRVLGKRVKDLPSPARFTASNGEITGSTRTGNKVVFVLGAPAEHADALLALGEAVTVVPDARDVNDVK